MKNEFTAFKGVNEVLFGTSRVHVHEILGSNFTEVTRNQFAANSSDYYEYLGFFIEYNATDLCEAIEFIESSNLYFKDENLLSMSYSELRSKYDNLSSNIEEEEEVGVTYQVLGFGFNKVFGSNDIESIIVFSKEYW